MIYRNTRPYAINLVNTIENKNYIVEAYSMTPDLPEEFAKRYGDVLVPLIAESKIVRGVGEKDSELFESSNGNDGFYESEQTDNDLIPLNETVKKGRGRPKKH